MCREGIIISKNNLGSNAGPQQPEYDSSFDFGALEHFTRQLAEEDKKTSDQSEMEKMKKDALFAAIMAEELSRIAKETKAKQAEQPEQPQKPEPTKHPKPEQPQHPKPEQPQHPKQPQQPAEKNPDEATENGMAKKKKKKIGMTVFYVVCAVFLVLAIAVAGLFVLDGGTIVDNIYIAGVPVGGLDKATAIAQVDAATNHVYEENALTIVLPDGELTIAPADSNVTLDAERAVSFAYSYGRIFGLVKVPGLTKVPQTRQDVNLEPYFELNANGVKGILDEKAAAVYAELKQTEVVFEERPVTVLPSEEESSEESSDEESEEAAEEEEKRAFDKVMLITKGITARTLDTEALYQQVLQAYSKVDFTPIEFAYTETAPDPLELQAIFDENCTAPVNALYDEEAGELIEDELGYGFVVDDVQTAFDAAEEGQILEIVFADLEAETTMDDLKGYMFNDKLSSYDSPHTSIANRTRNLELACEAIDGTIINDGEIFSFNNIVGERTASRGYKPAAVYVKGDTEDQLGGGVCQVASTIYLCALMADLEIVERSCHYFQVTYVPMGMDATVYWGSLDFKFKNNTGYPIRIDASVSNGYVHISIYGTETKDYTIKMTYSVTSRTDAGVSAVSYKHKLDADGNEISVTKEASSFYHYHKEDEDEEDEEDEDDEEDEEDEEDDHPDEPPPSVEPDPPVVDPPVVVPPVVDPPVEDPPVVDPPVVDPPVEDPPVEDPPVDDPPAE